MVKIGEARKPKFINQSMSKNLYSAPSRYLLRGAPDPGQAEKNSLVLVSATYSAALASCRIQNSIYTGLFDLRSHQHTY